MLGNKVAYGLAAVVYSNTMPYRPGKFFSCDLRSRAASLIHDIDCAGVLKLHAHFAAAMQRDFSFFLSFFLHSKSLSERGGMVCGS